jgi:hypothetical protein
MTHRLIQALLLGVPAEATFSMGISIVQAAEECQAKARLNGIIRHQMGLPDQPSRSSSLLVP